MADGRKTGGRAKGTPNKTTAVLKEAILAAAESVGSDGEGEGGLTGYLTFIAKNDIKAMAGLLAKVLPMQVTGDPDAPVYFATKEQRDAAVAAGTRADG
ncbi:hypothetical protein [Kaistia sp. MMO-174]|uniref:hypothetical protein n=1 Tax=Kaistia sp. MMO-174 TaxID=3081256 RepID=UPI003019A64E